MCCKKLLCLHFLKKVCIPRTVVFFKQVFVIRERLYAHPVYFMHRIFYRTVHVLVSHENIYFVMVHGMINVKMKQSTEIVRKRVNRSHHLVDLGIKGKIL